MINMRKKFRIVQEREIEMNKGRDEEDESERRDPLSVAREKRWRERGDPLARGV